MHRISRELSAIAFDAKGNLLPYKTFRRRAAKIFNRYNGAYLRAEVVQSQNAALMADRWHSFSDNTDRYLLQYRTARDERVRESHRILDGITLPKDHPFWDTHYPPNGWGCRCRVTQVLASRYQKQYQESQKRAQDILDNDDPRMVPPEFKFNPGKNLRLFPPKASYYKVNDNVAILIEKTSIKIHRKFIQDLAFSKLLNQKVELTLNNQKITVNFSKKGIKEAINQPHENYMYKNQAIINIIYRLKNAEFVYFKSNKKKNDYVVGYYYLKTIINNKDSFIVLRLLRDKTIYFYTITDSIKK